MLVASRSCGCLNLNLPMFIFGMSTVTKTHCLFPLCALCASGQTSAVGRLGAASFVHHYNQRLLRRKEQQQYD